MSAGLIVALITAGFLLLPIVIYKVISIAEETIKKKKDV